MFCGNRDSRNRSPRRGYIMLEQCQIERFWTLKGAVEIETGDPKSLALIRSADRFDAAICLLPICSFSFNASFTRPNSHHRKRQFCAESPQTSAATKHQQVR